MPTYEYACEACQHQFEEFQSITADPLTKCPQCGRKKLRRLIGTGGGIIFKGAGFYHTDYRSESYKSAAESENKSKSGGDSSKTESTPASTAESAKTDAKPANDAAAPSKATKKKKAE
ncbi:MAG: zinc ribbon domain-containing protein [Phycisphaerales bacterium]|nr:zinc ribbon domain-containing protein [Phycisphaerales bacterium]